MDAAVRVQPALSDLPSGEGTVRVGELYLGRVPRGAVILLCSSGALTADAFEGMNGLAEHGYESIAADLADSATSDETSLHDVRTLVDRLAGRGWSSDQIGVVGYGFGGRIALLAASELALGAAISIDPSGVAAPVGSTRPALVDAGRGVRTPWLGMFGDLDAQTSTASVAALGRSLRSLSPVFTQIVSYPGVSGDFYRNAIESIAHAAAFDSWQRVIEWLNARVVPRPTPLAEAWRTRQLVG
jgi:carboxymethylenebutenolidase